MGAARIRGTIEYFKCSTWGNLLKRCSNTGKLTKNNKSYAKKGIKLLMTKDEYYKFCDSQKQIILDFYMNGDTPSIDRIDPFGDYKIENLRILSFNVNRNLARTEKNIKFSTKQAGIAKNKKVFVKTSQMDACFLSIKYFNDFFKISETHSNRLFKNQKLANKKGFLQLYKINLSKKENN